jgi:hypothetical protein
VIAENEAREHDAREQRQAHAPLRTISGSRRTAQLIELPMKQLSWARSTSAGGVVVVARCDRERGRSRIRHAHLLVDDRACRLTRPRSHGDPGAASAR